MSNYFDTVADTWDDNPQKVERAEITAQKIKSLHFPSTKSVVDFGSGTGLLGGLLSESFDEVILADASSQMLNVANDKIRLAGLSNVSTYQLESLAELPAKYSAIVALMALHHVMDLPAFFASACSHLEPNGVLVIADLVEEDGSFHAGLDFDGHNGFHLPTLKKRVQASGFEVQNIEQYYTIERTSDDGRVVNYPLFMLVANKVT